MWSHDYLKELGYTQLPDEATVSRINVHTDLHYESMMAVIDPSSVRANTRFAAGDYAVHDVKTQSVDELVELGRKLIDYRADITPGQRFPAGTNLKNFSEYNEPLTQCSFSADQEIAAHSDQDEHVAGTSRPDLQVDRRI